MQVRGSAQPARPRPRSRPRRSRSRSRSSPRRGPGRIARGKVLLKTESTKGWAVSSQPCASEAAPQSCSFVIPALSSANWTHEVSVLRAAWKSWLPGATGGLSVSGCQHFMQKAWRFMKPTLFFCFLCKSLYIGEGGSDMRNNASQLVKLLLHLSFT